ncbi:hypothetical protein ElyMa_002709900 [Elysia marginata]|uniref:VWFD domain-containing protein n=1 Tax=Elysia marginata TaxID=1093978 RepID=A0AAV4HEL8_9GAST|nr:hypothetical protein ElyMa_002709900 [Elysia marginata]
MAGRKPTYLLATLSLLFVAASAAPCGSSPFQCLVGEATCKSGTCVCDNDNFEGGDGVFFCRKRDDQVAWLRLDPELRTFSNQTVKLPNLCRVLVAHVFQNLKDKLGNTIGNIQVKVYAYQAKHRGKIYVHGFDAATLISVQALGLYVGRGVRVYGTLEDGNPKITRQGSLTFSGDGPFGDVDVSFENSFTGVGIRRFRDAPNFREIFEVSGAGVTISFVPYDTVLRGAQPCMPGLLIKVDSKFKTTFQTAGNPIARTPDVTYDIRGTGLSMEALALEFSYNGPVSQTQPDPPGECSDIQSFIQAECTAEQYRRASSSCLWLLQEPRFVRCVDASRNGAKVQGLYNTCLKSFCWEAAMCSKVMADIAGAGCDKVRDIPVLARFMTGAMCPQ